MSVVDGEESVATLNPGSILTQRNLGWPQLRSGWPSSSNTREGLESRQPNEFIEFICGVRERGPFPWLIGTSPRVTGNTEINQIREHTWKAVDAYSRTTPEDVLIDDMGRPYWLNRYNWNKNISWRRWCVASMGNLPKMGLCQRCEWFSVSRRMCLTSLDTVINHVLLIMSHTLLWPFFKMSNPSISFWSSSFIYFSTTAGIIKHGGGTSPNLCCDWSIRNIWKSRGYSICHACRGPCLFSHGKRWVLLPMRETWVK